MPQTKLRALDVTILQLFKKLWGMLPDPSKNILNYFAGVSCLTLDAGKSSFDATCEVFVRYTKSDLFLLPSLRQIGFQYGAEILR